jgi:uncharacterized Zn finger protein
VSTRYGHTWWGRAWVEALEERAAVDAGRLARGRTYAGQDRVVSLTLDPGVVAASVRGSRRLNYRTHLDVRTYDDEQWHRVLEVVAGKAAHVAALLDGDVEPGLADDAREAGVELLPSRGDLKPRCSCPDDAHPCKHAAALAYIVAEAIDDDPFVLFHLRGRSRSALLTELRDIRRAATSSGADGIGGPTDVGDDAGIVLGTGPDPGEPARDAWARERVPLPSLPEVPDGPGRPAAWPDDPPPDAPFDTPGLLALAADAARRAWDQLRGDGDSALTLGPAADLTRREAAGPGDELPSLVRTGAVGADRTARAEAWRHGGAAALLALDEPAWRPSIAAMAAARSAIEAAGLPSSALTVHQNRITAPGFQLRLSHDGVWWRFEKRRGRWQIAAPPAEAADDLVDR